MDVLIDTQILIWSFDVNSPISANHTQILRDSSNKIFVSQISLMELAIKKNINKLPDFVPDVETVIDQFLSYGFELLQLTNEHIFAYKELPLYAEHKDPFDRFLIAVAMKENLTILTSDAKFQLYTSLIKVII